MTSEAEAANELMRLAHRHVVFWEGERRAAV